MELTDLPFYYGIELDFCTETIDGDGFVRFLQAVIDFEPDQAMINGRTYKWTGKEMLNAFAQSEPGNYLVVSSRDRKSSLSMMDSGGDVPFTSIEVQQRTVPVEIDKLISLWSGVEGFTSCFIHDYVYEKQQSAINETEYKVYGIPISLSEGLPFRVNRVRQKEFDINSNPGRRSVLNYSSLMPAFKMWFGKPFFELIDKDRILSFPHAIKVEQLENDVIFVQLFENVRDTRTQEGREAQWAFRKWCDFDTVIAQNSF